MSKKKKAKGRLIDNRESKPAEVPAPSTGPYLQEAHPPARRPLLLAVCALLLAAWFVFLVIAAFSS